MKLKNVKVGQRVEYKGNLSGHLEYIPVGCLGTVIQVDGTDRLKVAWDDEAIQWTYVGNFKKVK